MPDQLVCLIRYSVSNFTGSAVCDKAQQLTPAIGTLPKRAIGNRLERHGPRRSRVWNLARQPCSDTKEASAYEERTCNTHMLKNKARPEGSEDPAHAADKLCSAQNGALRPCVDSA